MPSIKAKLPDVELLIAGKGDYLEEVKAQVGKKGMGDCMHFLGHVSEEKKLDLYRRAWILAMPSMNEGWGMNVIEANACGTPCIAYKVPGLDESVNHGKSGFLAENDDQFADGLISVLTNPSLREELSQGAIDWAAQFDWDKAARQTLDILEKAYLS